jgi:hypothetical protein
MSRTSLQPPNRRPTSDSAGAIGTGVGAAAGTIVGSTSKAKD